MIAWRNTLLRAQEGCVIGTLSSGEDITERKHAEESLRQLSGQLLRLQDEERRKIARDLHDSTGQTLVALAAELSHFSHQASNTETYVRICHLKLWIEGASGVVGEFSIIGRSHSVPKPSGQTEISDLGNLV
jgi:hypothetical protein